MTTIARKATSALEAHESAKQHFATLAASLKSVGLALGVEVIDDSPLSIDLRVLDWPYRLEFHVTPPSVADYESRFVARRMNRLRPDQSLDQSYSIKVDHRGNFALGGDESSRGFNVSMTSDVEWVCMELVILESEEE